MSSDVFWGRIFTIDSAEKPRAHGFAVIDEGQVSAATANVVFG